MKTFKEIIAIGLLVFFCASCDVEELIEKVTGKACEVAVDEANDKFDDQIYEIQNSTSLTEEQITEGIKAIEEERQDALDEIQDSCEDGFLG